MIPPNAQEQMFEGTRMSPEEAETLMTQRREAGYWNLEQQNFVELLREFINDHNIPKVFANEFFMIFGMMSKHLVLGNIPEKAARKYMLKFYVIRDKYLNSLRYKDLTNELQMKLDNLEIIYRAILTRAQGDTRERVLQNTQVRQQITTSDFSGKGKKPGFFSRMLGFGRRVEK